MGIGQTTGEGRAVNAARAAITSPLLEAQIEGARGILVSIAGGPDLGLFEVNEAMEIIHGVAHPDANIIFGNVIDESMGDDVRVTVIAAGFERWEEGGRGGGKGDAKSGGLSSSQVLGWMWLGVRPIIRFASAPTARGRPSLTFTATTDGSFRMMPRPRT